MLLQNKAEDNSELFGLLVNFSKDSPWKVNWFCKMISQAAAADLNYISTNPISFSPVILKIFNQMSL